jgi:hypothetical protein
MRRGTWAVRMVGLAALAALAACAQTYVSEEPNGDQSVTTYSRIFGLDATSLNNREAVLDACDGDEPIVFDEKLGSDANGLYRRWNFGCIAK